VITLKSPSTPALTVLVDPQRFTFMSKQNCTEVLLEEDVELLVVVLTIIKSN
jgi:hypothetical protein